MDYYHKSYRIISRSDRDPENKLIRALITIETSPGPIYSENTTPASNQRQDDSKTNAKLSHTASNGE